MTQSEDQDRTPRELDRIREEVLAKRPVPRAEDLPEPEARSVPIPDDDDLYPARRKPPEGPVGPELSPDFLQSPTMDLGTWHEIWTRDVPVAITSHRAGIGSLIVWTKKVLRKFIRSPIADLFDRQRVYNAVLIHNVAAVQESLRVLTEKSVPALIQRNDALYAVQDQRIEAQTDRIEDLEKTDTHLSQQLYGLRDELRMADREAAEKLRESHAQLRQSLVRLQQSASGRAGDPATEPSARSAGGEDDVYIDFENLYRGSEAAIKEQQLYYIPHFRDVPGPVVDLGSGRGEFLDLCREHGVAAYGVDGDPNMVERGREKGLDVRPGDLLNHLADLEDGSLGGIFMAQVVEHLPRPRLLELARLAARKLAVGGRIAIETQNPLSPMVLARNFYLDLTHDRPLHPEGLRFLLEASGFSEVQVGFLSPFPEAEQLPVVEMPAESSAEVQQLGRSLNDVVGRVNDLLFGHQDFAVIATR